MPVASLKCKQCGEFQLRDKVIKSPFGKFCSKSHAIEYAQDKYKRDNERKQNKAKQLQAKKDKAFKAETRARKEAIKKRTGKNGYYDNLKAAIHYYVKHALRKGEPCFTCGKPQSHRDSPQAFHIGHFIPQKMVDPRRFMLENLRIQCYSCNVPNSGMRAEYRQRLIEEMGQKHVDWLECDINHKSLKEQYPEISDIKAEITRYRKLAKELAWPLSN